MQNIHQWRGLELVYDVTLLCKFYRVQYADLLGNMCCILLSYV